MYNKVINWVKNLTAKVIIRTPTRPQVHPPVASTPVSKNVVYCMNDPLLPQLIKNINYPDASTCPKFTVQGFKGGGFALGSRENRAATVYTTVINAVNMMNQHSDVKMNRWAATSNLIVMPEAGRDYNAYYDRSSLRFFYGPDVRNKMIYTADSSDIVAHETGHSILDFHRPDLFNIASLEVFAFHEGFADLIAILTTLQNDEVIAELLKKTNGNLTISNCVSQLAEQFGVAIYGLDPSPAYLNYCLREAVNTFKYQNPNTLPAQSDNYYQMSSEPHDFGRIILGTFYDILVMMYQYQISRGIQQKDAIKIAANTLAAYAIKAVRNTAVSAKFYEAFARSMLWVDSLNPSKPYTTGLTNIFINRNIISPMRALGIKHIGEMEGLCVKNDVKCVKMKDHKNLPLHQLSANLHNIHVEIPSQNLYVVNALGVAEDSVESSEEDMVKAAFSALKFLDKKGLISSDPKTPFEIKDGKLIRSHFACCFTKRPGDPEWGKLFKPENNKGCCSGGCGNGQIIKTEENVTSNIVKCNRFRYTKNGSDKR